MCFFKQSLLNFLCLKNLLSISSVEKNVLSISSASRIDLLSTISFQFPLFQEASLKSLLSIFFVQRRDSLKNQLSILSVETIFLQLPLIQFPFFESILVQFPVFKESLLNNLPSISFFFFEKLLERILFPFPLVKGDSFNNLHSIFFVFPNLL